MHLPKSFQAPPWHLVIAHKSIHKCHTIRSLTSANRNCLTNPLPLQSSRNMSSHPKDKNNAKFGHLPLSTSGPEECALTVSIHFSLPFPSSQPTQPDHRSRVQHSSAPLTTTKAAPFHLMNAKISSSTVCYLPVYRRWKRRSKEPIGSIAAERMRWRRILL